MSSLSCQFGRVGALSARRCLPSTGKRLLMRAMIMASALAVAVRGQRVHPSAPKWCPHLMASAGSSAHQDLLEYCGYLVKAHSMGLEKSAIVVDVGTDQGTEALTSRGFGHPVITFECRGSQAQRLLRSPWFNNDTGLRLVHACVTDHAGLGSLHRAVDSSSMLESSIQNPGAAWKANRERRAGEGIEPVPVMRLDSALDARSFEALGWSGLAGRRIGFLKLDVQGVEKTVLRGAVETLRRHRPFIAFEYTLLPESDRNGTTLINEVLRNAFHGGGHRRVHYSCECGRNDCFCHAPWA
ncbi:hypothetical protein EMIHUDRAFT_215188 [Emiliania huxleyi CCMP1516]|uniref:Methyltransferase FkbM domain-containing protein n=2 Tax=Emiliania huxleyi TaxID=2903 RepID=A0A0D3II21_EMIH1|nr:hypothetical protein EMIHUDRAFT_215188 [Emiliania huxleyi CCMP1516]EOD10906.1 hypothetical protein EMIHUDRAFT_215188 [Emiliania huxleyi CCMP1516]|eukprot:XP_005763335.1 hypothetical protein EMIHUDRAFT_215188 [Emiliania huxleyi CCMP1516]